MNGLIEPKYICVARDRDHKLFFKQHPAYDFVVNATTHVPVVDLELASYLSFQYLRIVTAIIYFNEIRHLWNFSCKYLSRLGKTWFTYDIILKDRLFIDSISMTKNFSLFEKFDNKKNVRPNIPFWNILIETAPCYNLTEY